ncbi:unnamed protein product [Scytosiphon promiscuus]
MDTKVVQAVAEYASTQAAAGTSRLFLAASGAASPALLLMGINTTETQAALNDSVQLLSMGIVPDSVGFSPRLLSSFKDFDDDDKRLDAAFRRQRRRRSKPLPVRLLGSLPSTINKAADLAYEVEQEVKYERAGSRANKLLRPMGVSLPLAKEKGLLMGRTPSESGVELLKARETNISSKAAGSSPTRILGSSVVESTPSVGEGTPASPKSGLLRDASAWQDAMPPAPHPFGEPGTFRRETANVVETPHSAGMKVSGSEVEPALAAVSAAGLSKRITSVDKELRLQGRGVRAAHAVLCSTEPIIAGLAKSSTREEVLLEELRNVARNVQQMYVLAEMSEAVEAAERYLGRLRELSANVTKLAVELQAYVAAAYARNGRLESIRSRLLEVRDRNESPRDLEAAELYCFSEFSDVLKAFDDEVGGCHKEAKSVGKALAVVWQESPERARNEAENAHEDALLAACRLWDASAVEDVGKREKAIDGVRRDSNDSNDVQALQVPTPVPENERVKSGGATSEVAQRDLAVVSGIEVLVERAESDQSRATEDGVAYDTASNVQQARATQMDGGRSATSARGTSRASPDSVAEETNAMFVTPGTGKDIARARGATVVADAMTVNDETTTEYDQSPSSRELVDATVVYDVTSMSAVAALGGEQSVRKLGGTKRFRGGFPPEEPTMGSDVSSNDIVLDRASSYVDIEVEVEDDVSEPTRIGLKVLDVSALLIEKALFVGLPTLVSGGSLVWDRVDNALNGAKGRKGWKLLKRLKKNGMDDVVT